MNKIFPPFDSPQAICVEKALNGVFKTFYNYGNVRESKKMPTATFRHIKGSELPPKFQSRFKIKPHQFFKVTVEIEDEENEKYDSVNVGDDIIQGLKEIISARKEGVDLPNAKDLLKII